ncbi:tripartite tricarboxylate transporter TctB family protein [Roseibium aggregatum]|uniref:Tripartite tricarboxylate transporter TctB family protein n=1 Tax=Roseibium aggregatum TaxID=187304 RepID=A0A939EDJ3_9HYPH|nr:tripartite tricarboxylate transporter TctB family protein [Roseibium aggregatum]MBN9669624.1 tripartite tricarboxylate transporter TctB family protein [Roseibium aggregatum]
MGTFTRVTIDFDTSHLLFPTIVSGVLALLGLAILIRDRRRIAGSAAYWRGVLARMDKMRFLGTLGLTLVYFSLMVPIGDFWPNTGLGFLICSVPFVFATGSLLSHDRDLKSLLPIAAISLTGPTFVWWLFTYPLFLTLP